MAFSVRLARSCLVVAHPVADALADQLVAGEVGIVVVRSGVLLRGQAHGHEVEQQRFRIGPSLGLQSLDPGTQLRRHRLELLLKLRREQGQHVHHLLEPPKLLLLVAFTAPHAFQKPKCDGLVGHSDHPQQAAGVPADIADELVERRGESVVQVGQFLRVSRVRREQGGELGVVVALLQGVERLHQLR